jgi:hypothetical protein
VLRELEEREARVKKTLADVLEAGGSARLTSIGLFGETVPLLPAVWIRRGERLVMSVVSGDAVVSRHDLTESEVFTLPDAMKAEQE